VEVNINADDPLNGARPKRKINAAAFETEALRRRFLMDAPGAPPLLPSPQPPQFHVALDGRDLGLQPWPALKQMVEDGKLTADTLVWNDTLDAWKPAREVAALGSLFARRAPPPVPSV
jgi:hypothetical protein